jgi:hypothetical protein
MKQKVQMLKKILTGTVSALFPCLHSNFGHHDVKI